MTTAAALTVSPTSGVVFGLAALGRGVDELAAAVARASTVGRGDLQGVERLIRRLESVKLAMIAAVDRDRIAARVGSCLLYTSPSPRDRTRSRMPSSA